MIFNVLFFRWLIKLWIFEFLFLFYPNNAKFEFCYLKLFNNSSIGIIQNVSRMKSCIAEHSIIVRNKKTKKNKGFILFFILVYFRFVFLRNYPHQFLFTAKFRIKNFHVIGNHFYCFLKQNFLLKMRRKNQKEISKLAFLANSNSQIY